jgi:hypothetical protein
LKDHYCILQTISKLYFTGDENRLLYSASACLSEASIMAFCLSFQSPVSLGQF